MAYLGLAFWTIVLGLVTYDAARRGRAWFFWGLLTYLTSLVGVVVWLFARRRTPPSEPGPGRVRAVAFFLAGVVVLVFGLVITSWTRTFVFQVATNDGEAMAPTIANGQMILVDRWTHHVAPPARGEVAVLRYPVNPDRMFVKRVVAVEGDTVKIEDGRVFVNDQLRADDEVPAEFRSHDEWGPNVVPEGYCFVLGDRRNNSSDSRHWGFVPNKYVLGRVAYRLTGPRAFTAVR